MLCYNCGMAIEVTGAGENNLKGVDASFSDSLTVVTGVSGSGKSSLVFDTLYREGQNRFNEAFARTPGEPEPVDVESIKGLGPVISLKQNTLNRNPNSTVATASGIHPFLRILFARYGKSFCSGCGNPANIETKSTLLRYLENLCQKKPVDLGIPLLSGIKGSHKRLLAFLHEIFPPSSIILDGHADKREFEDFHTPHTIEVRHWHLPVKSDHSSITASLEEALGLGINRVWVHNKDEMIQFALDKTCPFCGSPVQEISPSLFNLTCQNCWGSGCEICCRTGLNSVAARQLWEGYNFTEIQKISVKDFLILSDKSRQISPRLKEEISKRLTALIEVGLGYMSLNRSIPGISRGEAQRLKLALSLVSSLEDMVHILDEPTIGQHPRDVERLIPRFKELPGPVIFVEHDRTAARMADWAVDIGPGAGSLGGEVLYNGPYSGLLQQKTPTAKYFKTGLYGVVQSRRDDKTEHVRFSSCTSRNLQSFDMEFPLQRFTVLTGLSGSGKSTLMEQVIYQTLKEGKPVNCLNYRGPALKAVPIDQKPIGRNPRSNPGTYTKLSNFVRDLFARETGEEPGLFSFNTEAGQCAHCSGMGAREIKMHYLPSFWETCESCGGRRFNARALSHTIESSKGPVSIADFHEMSLTDLNELLLEYKSWKGYGAAMSILTPLMLSGLGYLSLGQPSPSLSGGEAQRIKLAKYLSRRDLKNTLFLLDEPSSGLHPADMEGLKNIINNLIEGGATVLVIEHNTDLIWAADWIIDLGPEGGPGGGHLIYQGPVEGILKSDKSLTGEALNKELRREEITEPESRESEKGIEKRKKSPIIIKGARANNLKNIDLIIPKNRLTVLAGVSGSGKSSLLHHVLEAEARRRYLESLSMYERQGTRERGDREVETLTGLGVTSQVSQGRRMFNPRSTVGSQTELVRHLAVLMAFEGTLLPEQKKQIPGERLEPRHFIPGNYGSSCPGCNGLGFYREPNPDKLIVHREKPLCAGAMYSPGFFPQGYLGKPFNGGYYVVQALGKEYGFDPFQTPWEKMTLEAQNAFLFGTDKEIDVYYENKKGEISHRHHGYKGFFYGWVGEWDLGGTYTDKKECPQCGGSGWDEPYRWVKYEGFTHEKLYSLPLEELADLIVVPSSGKARLSVQILKRRLHFLISVGLGYISLNRQTATLSAGEAMRVRLASLLGSRLTNLTILLDEPTRGMHPSEVGALLNALEEMRDSGNTVIMVEHDRDCLKRADYFIELGPEGGHGGGKIVFQGKPQLIKHGFSPTWDRLSEKRGYRMADKKVPFEAKGYMTIKMACENNLKIPELSFPLGVLTGVCGVSGSGKSTLLIDTIGRICAPKKHTTSMSQENLTPGKYLSLTGAPKHVFLLDQSRGVIKSPGDYLGVTGLIEKTFARAEGRDGGDFKKRCPSCRGRGFIRLDMEFLPSVDDLCETCNGTGLPSDLARAEYGEILFSDVFHMTFDQLAPYFSTESDDLFTLISHAGLGYLSLNQPGSSLSGGEAQRLKILKEILKKKSPRSLFILDEPTVGLHMEDVDKLISVLKDLVNKGHSVIVVEHNMSLLSQCDWLIELGPAGGPRGGNLIYEGVPESIQNTPSAPYIREELKRESDCGL
jgi:excinuclease ABC subunit A